jgi:hypothetical protein
MTQPKEPVAYSKKSTISSREIQTSVRLFFYYTNILLSFFLLVSTYKHDMLVHGERQLTWPKELAAYSTYKHDTLVHDERQLTQPKELAAYSKKSERQSTWPKELAAYSKKSERQSTWPKRWTMMNGS